VSYTGYSGLTGSMMLSLLLHVAVLALLFLAPSFPSPKLTFGPVYNVSLVDFAGKTTGGTGVSATEKGFYGETRYKPIVKRNVVEKNTVPIYRIDKKSNHKQDFEKAIEEIKKKVAAGEDLQRRPVNNASTKKYGSAENALTGAVSQKTNAKGVAGSGVGGVTYSSSGEGSGADAKVNAYYREIWLRIKEEWILPRAIIPKGGLESVIVITVLRTGTVTDFRFEKPSGNRYFDESAMKAVQKASPFPPLPGWLSGSNLSLGIRFHSSELVP
jgi:colicin import membrane protein